MSILLFMGTIHIHKAIVEKKLEIKLRILKDIQNNLSKHCSGIVYEEIYHLHKFYHEVDDINSWPFKPISIKKLIIMIITTFIPLILSIFGI